MGDQRFSKYTPLGGTHLKMGYWYVLPLRLPFTPSWPFPKTLFHNFLVPQGSTFAWNHKFLENSHFITSNFEKSSVLKLKIWSKTPNLVAVHSLSPYFRPFGPHTHTKVEYPLEYTLVRIAILMKKHPPPKF